jgi:hypothetical protein
MAYLVIDLVGHSVVSVPSWDTGLNGLPGQQSAHFFECIIMGHSKK